MFPVVRQSNDVGDSHDRRFEDDNSDDKEWSEDFGETVNKPERGLHQRVEDVGPRQVVVVEEREERDDE